MNERNPFSKKSNEQFGDNRAFLEIFSPVILEKLKTYTNNQILEHLVIFRSPPGFGKSTLLRLFSAGTLSALQQQKNSSSKHNSDTIKVLNELDVFGKDKPKLLGIYLNVSQGFGEIEDILGKNSFPVLCAYLNAKLILKIISSLKEYYDLDFNDSLDDFEIKVTAEIDWPWGANINTLDDLYRRAEEIESDIFDRISRLDLEERSWEKQSGMASFSWLSKVKFYYKGECHIKRFLVMIDDVHQLRTTQREKLLENLTVMRLQYPIWISERLSGLGSKDIIVKSSQKNRDYLSVRLDELFSSGTNSNDFRKLALNITQYRLKGSNVNFENWLNVEDEDLKRRHLKIQPTLSEKLATIKDNIVYNEWYKDYVRNNQSDSHNVIKENEIIQKLLTSVAKYENKSLTLPFGGLPLDSKPDADTGFVKYFLHKKYNLPYYYGEDNLIRLATYNALEYLYIAEAIFEEIYKYNLTVKYKSKSIKAINQEQIVKRLASERFESIESFVYDHEKAKNLLTNFSNIAIQKSVKESSPYSPSITGFALSEPEMNQLVENQHSLAKYDVLLRLLSDLRASNYLFIRRMTKGNEKITIFYLNRLLCAHFDLAIGLGGWNKFSLQVIANWMEPPEISSRKQRQEFNENQGKLI